MELVLWWAGLTRVPGPPPLPLVAWVAGALLAGVYLVSRVHGLHPHPRPHRCAWLYRYLAPLGLMVAGVLLLWPLAPPSAPGHPPRIRTGGEVTAGPYETLPSRSPLCPFISGPGAGEEEPGEDAAPAGDCPEPEMPSVRQGP